MWSGDHRSSNGVAGDFLADLLAGHGLHVIAHHNTEKAKSKGEYGDTKTAHDGYERFKRCKCPDASQCLRR